MTVDVAQRADTAGDRVDHHRPRPWSIVWRLTARSWLNLVRIPAATIPMVIMPLFFTVAFAGAFSALVLIPGYPTDNILSWMGPFAALQGAAFTGLGASFALGRDIEGGFYDRLLLSPASRLSIAGANVFFVLFRTVIPVAIVLLIGAIGGMDIPAGILAAVMLLLGAWGVAAIAALWGMGVTYRIQKQSAGGLVQVGVFIAMFLSIGMMPVDLMQGWLPHVAKYNPMTYIMELARQGFIGEVAWESTWPGLVSIACGVTFFAIFAWRMFQRVTP
ncbi:MAG: hypothetical protein JJLCMIEE_00819 [Acidimicrobiales bacterium]|nr:hypothetical protein [Acidimicrobiales bacterium]